MGERNPVRRQRSTHTQVGAVCIRRVTSTATPPLPPFPMAIPSAHNTPPPSATSHAPYYFKPARPGRRALRRHRPFPDTARPPALPHVERALELGQDGDLPVDGLQVAGPLGLRGVGR